MRFVSFIGFVAVVVVIASMVSTVFVIDVWPGWSWLRQLALIICVLVGFLKIRDYRIRHNMYQ